MVSAAISAPEQPTTQAQAAAGHLRAIALWLNTPLVAHGLYAQVQAAQPGCLRILIEFNRPPKSDPLTRFICHRIWELNSPLIEGIHLVVRPIGHSRALWERRVRIVTPANRRQQSARSQAARAKMPPRLGTPRRRIAFNLPKQHLQTLRTMMLTGSAVAAFVFGCLVEVVMSASPEPALPLQKKAAASPPTPPETPPLTTDTSSDAVTPVAYTTDSASQPARSQVVSAALEPVAVIEHTQLSQPADPTLTLVFGGDVTLDDLPYASYENDADLLDGVNAYQDADVAMVSLENSLAIAATSLEEDFLNRQRPDALNLLQAGGVDIINLSDEGTMAFGEQGLVETLETLDRNGVYRVGAGRNEREARRPEILDVKGQRVAYLSYNQGDQHRAYGDLGGVNPLDKQRLIDDIQAIRDEVDWLIVNYHWQDAVPERAADWQTNLARLAVDQGADVVVGHHPSQLQGAEIYKGRPIAYSLGDFVLGNPASTPQDTVVLKVSLSDRQMKVDLLPVVVRNSQPEQATGPEAAAILQKIRAASQDYETPLEDSVILDLPAPSAPSTAPAVPDSPFVDTAPEAPEEGVKTSPDPAEKSIPSTPPAARPDTAPAPEEDGFSRPDDSNGPANLEMEPIPDQLLEDWGPKMAPDEVPFTPIPEEASPEATPAPSPEPEVVPSVPTAAETGNGTHADEAAEADSPAPPAAIAPYSEPLVGPLSAQPDAMADDPVETARYRLGLPQPRVLKPLNATAKKSPATAAQKDVAIAATATEAPALGEDRP